MSKRERRDRNAIAGRIENECGRVENLEGQECRLIIAPTLCFSDIECFEDTVVFEDLSPAPAPVPPLEARVFVLDFCSRFINANLIRKTVRYRVFIRYLAENGTTVERIRDRTFTQEVDVTERCLPDVCADGEHSTFLCRVTDLCVRRACLEETEEAGEAPNDIVVEVVGRLAIQLFVKQRLCVRLCDSDRCPQGIEAAELCIENTDCIPCRREEAEAENDCCRNHRNNRVEAEMNRGCRTCR